jgi:hypothetical protein
MSLDDDRAVLDRVPDDAPKATSITGTLPYDPLRCRRGFEEHGAAKLGEVNGKRTFYLHKPLCYYGILRSRKERF